MALTAGDEVQRRAVAAEDPAGDAALVRLTLSGDREAFGALVDRYERIILSLAYQKVGARGEAEDVAQESFLKAYGALAELKEPERFGSWLYGIAFRAAVDHLRRRARRGDVASVDGALEVAAPDRGDEAERREESERVMAAVGALPEKYRLVLTLRYLRHMSYAEIADHLGEPAGTVANRIHRAANMLRERMERVPE